MSAAIGSSIGAFSSRQTRQETRDFTTTRQLNGRWKRASCCPVMLEMTHNQSRGNTMMVVPLKKQYPPETAPQPVQTEVCVDDMQSSVYGTLRAKQNCETNEINIVVEQLPDTTPDFSYQFNYYIWHNPDDDSGPTRPPSYILLENLFYRDFYISWDLDNQSVQCKQLTLPPSMVMEELDASLDDSQIQRFVWVIPIDDDHSQQYALKTYGESHFLVFRGNTEPVLISGTEINPKVTIFMFPNNAFN